MHDLLRRWEALEPERCRYVRGLSAQVRLGGQAQNIHVDGAGSRAIIQAAVQEACKARGWFYTLQRWDTDGKEVYALIGWRASEPGKANPKVANDWGEDEATTLLTVYLQALEAQ